MLIILSTLFFSSSLPPSCRNFLLLPRCIRVIVETTRNHFIKTGQINSTQRCEQTITYTARYFLFLAHLTKIFRNFFLFSRETMLRCLICLIRTHFRILVRNYSNQKLPFTEILRLNFSTSDFYFYRNVRLNQRS